MTGVLQAHAHSSGTPIDRLAFNYAVLSDASGPADIQAAPDCGVYIYGLYLEAARWVHAALEVQLDTFLSGLSMITKPTAPDYKSLPTAPAS